MEKIKMSNIVESCYIVNPQGLTEECAKIIVDEVGVPYSLTNVAEIGKNHVLHFYVKSEQEGEILACGREIVTSAEWEKQTIPFRAVDTDIYLVFNKEGTYYFYKTKLEVGNKNTDWTPAPEDIEEVVGKTDTELRQLIIENRTTLLSDCESIILSALESYTKTGEFDALKTTVTSQLELLSNQLELKFTETTQELKKVNGELQEQLNSVTKHFTFNVDGMTIGQTDNPNKINIDHDEINILVNDTVVQQFRADGTALIPELKVTKGILIVDTLLSEIADGVVGASYAGGES